MGRQLDNWLAGYKKFSQNNECPDSFHIWAGLWAISAAIERKAWLEFGNFNIFPNLFVLLVGPPAVKKGTACHIAMDILTEVEGLNLGPNMATKEAVIQKMAMGGKSFAYAEENLFHSSLAVMSPEWSNLIGEQDRDFCNSLCELYDCNKKFDKWTKTQGNDNIKNVYLTMLGASTAKQITDCLPAASIGGGLTSRIIFVVEPEVSGKKFPRPALSKEDLEVKQKLIDDLKEISSNVVGKFDFTSGAEMAFDKWYLNREDKLKYDDRFASYCDRKPIHLLKVAMLLTISRGDSMRIGAGEILDAQRLLDNLETNMPMALGGVGLSTSAPIINSIIEKMKVHKKLSEKQLQKMLWRDCSKNELRDALSTMLNFDPPLVKWTDEGNFIWIGGR